MNTNPFPEREKPKKLPQNAKKVFSGVLFDTYQWPLPLYDGTPAIFESVARNSTAFVILVGEDGNILLQTQSQPHIKDPYWSLPGGYVENGEDPIDGAKRELLEETGYEASKWTLWKRWEGRMPIVWDSYFYIAHTVKKIAEPHLEGGERIENRWISQEEFLRLGTEPKFNDYIFQYFLLQTILNKNDAKKFQELLRTCS